MHKSLFFIAFVLFSPTFGWADELARVFRFGKPIADHSEAWEDRIQHASWIDDEWVVFFSRGKVSCLSTKSGEIRWTLEMFGENVERRFGRIFDGVFDWSVSRSSKRLAIRDPNLQIKVIDCTTGTVLFQPTQKQLAEILGLEYVTAGSVVLSPKDGRLIIESGESTFGRHAYILDSTYSKLDGTFDIDADPRSISISSDGKRAAVIAEEDVLSVREILENREVFFRGKRIHDNPEIGKFTTDVPVYSNIRDSGDALIVYSRDDSWSTGTVTVHNLENDTSTTFSGRNGHIELDVAFRSKRLVLTGTSTELAVLDFSGEVIAAVKHATMNRNLSVEFSPSEDRILVGSWDNTISVFAFVTSEEDRDRP